MTTADATAGSSWSAGADFPARLARALAGPLPGREAHRRWIHDLCFGRHAGPPPHDARPAATLLLLYPHEDTWRAPLIVRPAEMLAHAGQVCLPGGKLHAGETPEQGAVREAQEELGVSPAAARVVGRLTPLWIFVSNFWVTPCVAVMERRPDFHPDPREVAAVLELPLPALFDPARRGRHRVTRRGLAFDAPHFAWQGHAVWGATCLMLGELAAVLEGLAE